MKVVNCSKCGSNELEENGHVVVCIFCRVQFKKSSSDLAAPTSSIALVDDVNALILRCEKEPHNRRRLINLILDIDPSNIDVYRFIR